jgi:GNAT superfamily N-acetyltransferase
VRIRAFFVEPDYERRGIGQVLLERCEAEARAQGFTRFELMGTLSGVPLYQALAYQPGEMLSFALAANDTMQFVPRTIDGMSTGALCTGAARSLRRLCTREFDSSSAAHQPN